MKIFAFVFGLAFLVQAKAQESNLLSGKYSREELQRLLISQQQWTPFPHITDRTAWSRADDTIMKAYLEKAESYIHYEWPAIPATTSLLIERTGERAGYEKISFQKRRVLGTLLLAEVYEDKGRTREDLLILS